MNKAILLFVLSLIVIIGNATEIPQDLGIPLVPVVKGKQRWSVSPDYDLFFQSSETEIKLDLADQLQNRWTIQIDSSNAGRITWNLYNNPLALLRKIFSKGLENSPLVKLYLLKKSNTELDINIAVAETEVDEARSFSVPLLSANVTDIWRLEQMIQDASWTASLDLNEAISNLKSEVRTEIQQIMLSLRKPVAGSAGTIPCSAKTEISSRLKLPEGDWFVSVSFLANSQALRNWGNGYSLFEMKYGDESVYQGSMFAYSTPDPAVSISFAIKSNGNDWMYLSLPPFPPSNPGAPGSNIPFALKDIVFFAVPVNY